MATITIRKGDGGPMPIVGAHYLIVEAKQGGHWSETYLACSEAGEVDLKSFRRVLKGLAKDMKAAKKRGWGSPLTVDPPVLYPLNTLDPGTPAPSNEAIQANPRR